MDESCLSLIAPMAGMMWCSMIPLIALGGVAADDVAVDQIAVSALGVAVPLLSVSGKPVDAPLPNREIIFFLHIIASFLANEQYHRKQEIATEKNIK